MNVPRWARTQQVGGVPVFRFSAGFAVARKTLRAALRDARQGIPAGQDPRGGPAGDPFRPLRLAGKTVEGRPAGRRGFRGAGAHADVVRVVESGTLKSAVANRRRWVVRHGSTYPSFQML